VGTVDDLAHKVVQLSLEYVDAWKAAKQTFPPEQLEVLRAAKAKQLRAAVDALLST
jgi:hypothetical protein